jgi:hypothetical protein
MAMASGAVAKPRGRCGLPAVLAPGPRRRHSVGPRQSEGVHASICFQAMARNRRLVYHRARAITISMHGDNEIMVKIAISLASIALLAASVLPTNVDARPRARGGGGVMRGGGGGGMRGGGAALAPRAMPRMSAPRFAPRVAPRFAPAVQVRPSFQRRATPSAPPPRVG